jgi:hypothetical protein
VNRSNCFQVGTSHGLGNLVEVRVLRERTAMREGGMGHVEVGHKPALSSGTKARLPSRSPFGGGRCHESKLARSSSVTSRDHQMSRFSWSEIGEPGQGGS